MKIVILGAGKVGATLVESFLKEHHNVLVIDNDENVVMQTVNKHDDVQGKVGNGLERAVLTDSGVSDCDFFIASTPKDETNILSCVFAKKLGAKFTIARVRDPEFFNEMNNMQEELGLDMFFNPEYKTAQEIESVLKFPFARNVESFADGKATMFEFQVGEDNKLVGKSVLKVIRNYVSNVLFAAVSRGDKIFIPNGDFEIAAGDILHLVSSEAEIYNFCKVFDMNKRRAKSVFIVGGGKVAYYLANELLKSKVNVKILEKDRERATELSEQLPNASILYGDGSEQDVLDEEGFKSVDACVALTGLDELNVIVSLYAKEKKINKIVTKVDRTAVYSMVESLGLDSVVSPKDVISNHIIRFVRAHSGETGSGINTLYKVSDKVEALEFTATENFSGLKKEVKQLKLKSNILICGIVRDGEFILPRGDSVIELNDKVIIITESRQISELGDILR